MTAWLILPALVLGIAAVLLCPGGLCRMAGPDRAILTAFQAIRSPALDAFFSAATWLGSLAVLGPACLFVAWRRRGQRRVALGMILSLAGASILAHGTKLLVARPRPDLYPFVSMPLDFSFPSAHAMQATGFVLGWLAFGRGRRGPAEVPIAILLVALVGVSRIYLQVHFPTDVAAGVAAAAALVVGLKLLFVHRAGIE